MFTRRFAFELFDDDPASQSADATEGAGSAAVTFTASGAASSLASATGSAALTTSPAAASDAVGTGATLTVVTGGVGPLAKLTVVDPLKLNHAVSAYMVQCHTASSGGDLKIISGQRGRRIMLLPVDSTSARYWSAAVRDVHGVFSEWSPRTNFACGNHSAGATEASIGSGSTRDLDIQEPGVAWPLPAMGSSDTAVERTLVTPESYVDELRRTKWPIRRRGFVVKLDSMSETEGLLLAKFLGCANVGQKYFVFDWQDLVATKYISVFCRVVASEQTVSQFGHTYQESEVVLAESPVESCGNVG